MIELLPCPFCGFPVKLKMTYDGGEYWGVAHSCGPVNGNIYMHDTPEGAAEIWNQRFNLETENSNATNTERDH